MNEHDDLLEKCELVTQTLGDRLARCVRVESSMLRAAAAGQTTSPQQLRRWALELGTPQRTEAEPSELIGEEIGESESLLRKLKEATSDLERAKMREQGALELRRRTLDRAAEIARQMAADCECGNCHPGNIASAIEQEKDRVCPP